MSRGRFVPISTLVLSLAGLAVSIYLTIEHFTQGSTLICLANGAVDCVKVTSSPQSEFLGIPVAVLGLAFFIVMTVLCLPFAWRKGRSWDIARLGISGAGVAFVLWLVYAEIAIIHAVCIWCTVVHVIAVVMFFILLFDWSGGDYENDFED